jgi:hypothetical protein
LQGTAAECGHDDQGDGRPGEGSWPAPAIIICQVWYCLTAATCAQEITDVKGHEASQGTALSANLNRPAEHLLA